MQIYQQVKKDIHQGVLKEGQILAGSRGLAKTLNVSRNTVDSAYSQLLAEGYIKAKKGIGYAVTKLPEIEATEVHQTHVFPQIERHIESETEQNVLYDLTNSSHTSDLFPKALWKRYTVECLERLEKESKISSYQDKQGELYLRCSLLSYLERIRGVHCNEQQIVITCGLQQSLDYICSLLPTNRSTILMEEPGYNKAVAVFQNKGQDMQTVPVDEDGLVVAALPTKKSSWVVYSTPSHQFPTGVTMPISRRYELLEWANANDAYIIEDDYDSELRYYAKPIPALQSIDRNNRVIYLGTFSKALSPSMRMGYMILPPQLYQVYLKKYDNYNSTAPILNQYVIARLIETGQYDRHVRRLNNVFRKRLERFTEAFSDVMGKVEISSNGSGQYFLMRFSAQVEESQLIKKALKNGVKVYSTMQFWHEKADCPPNTLFLGFSKIPLEDIQDCVRRLKVAWRAWL